MKGVVWHAAGPEEQIVANVGVQVILGPLDTLLPSTATAIKVDLTCPNVSMCFSSDVIAYAARRLFGFHVACKPKNVFSLSFELLIASVRQMLLSEGC